MELGGLGLADKRNPDYTCRPSWDFTWKEAPNLNTKQRVKKKHISTHNSLKQNTYIYIYLLFVDFIRRFGGH